MIFILLKNNHLYDRYLSELESLSGVLPLITLMVATDLSFPPHFLILNFIPLR